MAEAISSILDSDWAWLPGDILDLILEKLISTSDFIRLGAVCKHWQSVALVQKPLRLKSSSHKQLPMVIVTDIKNRGGSSALYGVTQGKDYSFELHDCPNYHHNRRRCYFCGSSHGWLVYLDDNYLVLTLFNPFTGRSIRLPPFKEAPKWRQERLELNYVHDLFIAKVVLSADPCLFPNYFEVLILYHELDSVGTQVAHFKAGNNNWTHIDTRTTLADVIYHRGQFLVVTKKGELFSINVNSIPAAMTPAGATRPPALLNFNGYYIVESSRGDLWLVVETSNKEFWVLCAFWDDGGPQWVEIKSIGTDALFLSKYESMCVSVLDFPECLPNSIYILDRVSILVSLFNLENRSLLKYCWSKYLWHTGPRFWILPTMV